MGYPELILGLTGVVIFISMVYAYVVSRDPLHPMVVIGPMLFYMYSFRPLAQVFNGSMAAFFAESNLVFVTTFKFVAVTLFCLGALHGVRRVQRGQSTAPQFALTSRGHDLVYICGCGMGLIAVGAYVWMVQMAGGFDYAYSVRYGGYSTFSGYIGEAPLLSLPAVVLLAIARQGLRLRFQDVVLALFFSSPFLFHGFMGARRGPVFFAVSSLILAWYVQKSRRPSLPKVITGVGLLGLLALFLLTFRDNIYLGSELRFDPADFAQEVLSPRNTGGDEYRESGGLILVAMKHGQYNWGGRWLVNFLIRPIPRQLWPTKYSDLGFGWMDNQLGMMMGYSDSQWIEAAGFRPVHGGAMAFDATFFADFSWGGFIGCYLFGWFFAYVWRKDRIDKGIWHLLFIAALALSIYVATQDPLSVLVRWVFIAVPASLVWSWAIKPHTMQIYRRKMRFFPTA